MPLTSAWRPVPVAGLVHSVLIGLAPRVGIECRVPIPLRLPRGLELVGRQRTAARQDSSPVTVEEVAAIALALPEVTEGLRFRNRTWFVAGRSFAWERPLS